jgi:DNA-binding GntR family transcriptional regulator
MAPTVERPEPPYMQIVEHIRRQIRSGQLRDGDLVPSVRQLARDWHVSPPTAQKALTRLQSEGYVRGVHGTGTVVSASGAMSYAGRDRMRAAGRVGRIYPPNERAEISLAEVVEAPETIADALGLDAGAEVVRRHRVTYRDDVPVSASTTWMPGAFAQQATRLLSTERILEGTVGYVAQVTGRSVFRGVDQQSARAATEQDAADLRLPVGSPVACGRNWWYDADGAVVEYGESVSIPGRWSSHEYEVG